MRSAPRKLTALVGQVVEPMGYELVGVEYLAGQEGGSLLRVYIDQERGITLDDCTAVSRQLSAVFDVEDPVKEHYTLEVSSPGLDRPLFYEEHFQKYAGSRVKLRMALKIEGRRRFEGILKGLQDQDIVLEVDGEQFLLPLDQVETARLVPEF
jgi:ribosome maturation factor RimP